MRTVVPPQLERRAAIRKLIVLNAEQITNLDLCEVENGEVEIDVPLVSLVLKIATHRAARNRIFEIKLVANAQHAICTAQCNVLACTQGLIDRIASRIERFAQKIARA